VEWAVLESNFTFGQPQTLREQEETDSTLPERQIWTQIRSYFVRRRDFARLVAWARKQDFMGRWMPESHAAHRIFMGEFYWSPAYRYFEQPYYQRYAWTRGDRGEPLPCSVLVSTDSYSWEKGYDCSIDESISAYLPCQAVADGEGLGWDGVPAQWTREGVLTVQDPSILEPGPGALLIRADRLNEFLAKEKLGLLWTVIGEKVVYRESLEDWPGRLEFSGSYHLRDGKISSNFKTRFEGPRSRR
jgi:hypothetical protein